MSSFKKVLVSIDLTEHTEHILQQSANFIREIGASAVLLHCIPALKQMPSEYMPQENMAIFMEETITSIKQQLQEIKNTFFQGIELVIESPVGEPIEEIHTITEKHSCDIILIGESSKTSLEKFFLGSVASGIIASSRKPVLLLRTR